MIIFNIVKNIDYKPKDIARILFLVALTIVLYWPVLRWLSRAWVSNEYYNHGFFLLIVSLLLIWFSREGIRNAPVRRQELGFPVLIVACSFYVAGFVIQQPMILSFSLLLFIAALIVQLLGIEKSRPVLFPISVMALAIPLPSFGEFGIMLQEWSASGASNAADLLGMDVLSEGNVITIGGEDYEVAPACSGLNRIMPLFSLTAILVYVLHGQYWKKGILMALVIPVALFSNIIRIILTMWVGSHWSPDAALGIFHDINSIALFMVAVGIMILAAYLLRMLHVRKGLFS